jgi:hypothetical protein
MKTSEKQQPFAFAARISAFGIQTFCIDVRSTNETYAHLLMYL